MEILQSLWANCYILSCLIVDLFCLYLVWVFPFGFYDHFLLLFHRAHEYSTSHCQEPLKALKDYEIPPKVLSFPCSTSPARSVAPRWADASDLSRLGCPLLESLKCQLKRNNHSCVAGCVLFCTPECCKPSVAAGHSTISGTNYCSPGPLDPFPILFRQTPNQSVTSLYQHTG